MTSHYAGSTAARQPRRCSTRSMGRRKKKAKSATADAQDRFLKLLTTQLKNQDPLNPMDNAQMTSQLAQISTVDGIEKLNATLQKLLSSTVEREAMQAAALVGHQVMVRRQRPAARRHRRCGRRRAGRRRRPGDVTIKDANGIGDETLNLGKLDAGMHNFTWDGKTMPACRR
jgi:flagellar basal-body rod modification protein FlgD